MEVSKITDLKKAVRNDDRVNVFLDGSFSFSLDVSQIINYKLKVGKILTSEEIKELKKASAFGKLYVSTLEWVLSRPRSVKETRDHLNLKLLRRKQLNVQRKKNRERLKKDPELKSSMKDLKIYTSEVELFSDEDIKNVISRLIEKGYLNDARFAELYIENFKIKQGVSERRLREELKKKGIEAEIINQVLENSERDPVDEIKKIVQKKQNKYTTYEKMLSYVVRQGFPYDLAKEIVGDFFDSNL